MDNQNKHPIMYVVLNGELNMSPGKAAAQTAHAVATMIENGNTSFSFRGKSYRRTVIVLQAQNQQQIKNLWEYLVEAKVSADYYIDEGSNEVPPYTITALAVEPFDDDNTELREIFNALPLYGNRYGDYDDDYESESTGTQVQNELRTIRNLVYQNGKSVREVKEIIQKPKWYSRLFKRKHNEFVS